MIKKFFFLAFICALVSCQKETIQLSSNNSVSSKTMKTDPLDFRDLPLEVRNVIANGGAGHFGCETTYSRPSLSGGLLGVKPFVLTSSLGVYAYPYSPNLNPLSLINSSLPCQPSIPYFLIGYIDKQVEIKNSDDYAVTFLLLSNPNYFNTIEVFDVNWELNGQNDPVQLDSFTISDLQIGESNTVVCKVFSTQNNISVYSQEMTFDFEVLLDIGSAGVVIEYGSGDSYACTNTGASSIIAP